MTARSGALARLRLQLVPLAGVLALAAAGCGRQNSNGAIHASGHVEATEIRVSTKIAGHIVRYDPIEGDRIAAGEVLAVIDTVDLAIEAGRRAADLATARANLALLEAGSRREEIGAARARVERALADMEAEARDLARLDTLLVHGAIARQVRDDAATRRDMARAEVTEAREQLKRLEAGARPEELAAARARVAVAEAALATARQWIVDTSIIAPRSGVLSEKLAEAGEVATAGQPIAVLIDLESAWLNVYVPEPDLGRIRLGQAATITTDDGQTRTGKVSVIASRAEFTPKNVQTRDERVKLVYRVRIALDNKDGLFKPGMPAEAVLAPIGS